MTLVRFEQIERFLHVSDHTTLHVNYYDKVQPLMGRVQSASQKHYVPFDYFHNSAQSYWSEYFVGLETSVVFFAKGSVRPRNKKEHMQE
jgi:hypothetical protein